jgi:hypothetical protein
MLTRVAVAYIRHDFGRSFYIDFHARALQSLDDHAHPAQRRNKLKCPDDSEL